MSELLTSVTDWVHANLGLSPGAQTRVALTLPILGVYVVVRILAHHAFDRRIPDVSRKYTVTKT